MHWSIRPKVRNWLVRSLGIAAALGSVTLPASGQDSPSGYQKVLTEDFSEDKGRWRTIDPSSWEWSTIDGESVLAIRRRESNYQPKVRSPLHLALLQGPPVDDFLLRFRVRNLEDTGGHRDCCVFFGYQDPEHFYYVHLGAKPDPASGQIMIVDGAPRRPLTDNKKEVPWSDGWHWVQVERNVKSGTIRVYFDDMTQPLYEVVDKSFGKGLVGFGSFDDKNAFDDLSLQVPEAKAAAIKKQIDKEYPARPAPTVSDLPYGPHPRQRIDFWQASSTEPTPVVVLIHGGGWVGGDKRRYGKSMIDPFLNAGISVAAINYRFIPQAMEAKIEPPVKGCLGDAARAIQTLRAKADEWNLDPDRFAATGSSAGACTSLWLALHDDLADPNGDDPIARQSTRLLGVAVTGAQTSLDPVQLRSWIPNAIYGGHAFGFAAKGRSRAEEFEQLMSHRAEVLPWIQEYSPIELVSEGDPPLFLEYPNQKKPPVLGQKEDDPTHSALYGTEFQKRCLEKKVSCDLVYPGHPGVTAKNNVEFLLKLLKDR
ncbi:MAG: alpha/beta hydrolase [Pirellulaceae bacterium]|jgi:acetyl esterase/lipase